MMIEINHFSLLALALLDSSLRLNRRSTGRSDFNEINLRKSWTNTEITAHMSQNCDAHLSTVVITQSLQINWKFSFQFQAHTQVPSSSLLLSLLLLFSLFLFLASLSKVHRTQNHMGKCSGQSQSYSTVKTCSWQFQVKWLNHLENGNWIAVIPFDFVVGC